MASSAITDDFTTNPWWWEAAPREFGLDEALPDSVDVAVVGSGYTGLSAARTLANAGRSVVVLEANALGEGASSRSAGFVGRALLGGFSQIAEQQGLDDAVTLYRGAEEAYDFTIDLMESLDMSCHLAKRGRILPVWNKEQYDATEVDFELQQRHLNIEGQMLSAEQLAQELNVTNAYGALLVTNTASVHPAMYHTELLAATRRAGVQTCAHARVDSIRHERAGKTLKTSRGDVRAKEVVIATNAYTGSETAWIRRRLIRTPGFMAATGSLAPSLLTKLMPSQRTYVEYGRNMMNFWRPAPDDNRLLFGGQTGLLHKSNEEIARRLQMDLDRVFPELAATRFSHVWKGWFAFTMDRLPHLGFKNDVYFAVGCNGSGLPMGTYIGHKTALKLLGDKEGTTPFDDRPFPLSPSVLGYPWYWPFMTAWARWQDSRGKPSKGF
jgi:glycine/D-amino acid oxidase-like deaminating enzyme